MTSIKPLGSLILMKTIKEEDRTTKSGLVLAAAFSEPTLNRGTVVAVGTGDNDNSGNHYDIPLEPGDVVLYSSNQATEVEDDDGEKYHFINWRQLFGTVGK
jgi:co-chaperonin GroES (HSP10)